MLKVSFEIGNKKTESGRTVNQTDSRFRRISTGNFNFPIKEIYQKLSYHKPLEIASRQEVPEAKKPEQLNISRKGGFLVIDMETPLEELQNAVI